MVSFLRKDTRKMNGKAYDMIKSLPVFWLVYVTACYAFSFNMFYDDWFHEFSVKNFECSTMVLGIFWILCIKEKWGYWSSASLVFLTIVSVADNIYLISKNLQIYDSYFALAAYTIAIFYWRNEMEFTHGKFSS